nr:MAG TPA: hypothetical protein [Caudoviricetes sp.]
MRGEINNFHFSSCFVVEKYMNFSLQKITYFIWEKSCIFVREKSGIFIWETPVLDSGHGRLDRADSGQWTVDSGHGRLDRVDRSRCPALYYSVLLLMSRSGQTGQKIC